MNMLTSQEFYLNVKWDTYLYEGKITARHTVILDLHCCKGKRRRDSIQIVMPPDATTILLSAKCVGRPEVHLSNNINITTNTYNIELTNLIDTTQVDDLKLEIEVSEEGSLSLVGKSHIYIMGFDLKPRPADFTYTIHLPSYCREWIRKLVNQLARLIHRPGAYDMTAIGRFHHHIDPDKGSITFRFGSKFKFAGPASRIGTIFKKALRPSLGSILFGFVVGFLSSLFASWIYEHLKIKG